MPFQVIDPSEVVAKAPVDDLLMGRIKNDLDYLLSAIGASNVQLFDFRVNGELSNLLDTPTVPFPGLNGKRIDGAIVAKTQTLTRQKLYLERAGASGSLIVDIRKYVKTDTPIMGISSLYYDAIQSVARAGSSLPTQSVSRSTSQIPTQSITYFKAAINVQSVGYFQSYPGGDPYTVVNLSTLPDSDWKIGDYVRLSGTTSADGDYPILAVNRDGAPNVLIAGALGANQLTPAGTAQLLKFSFNYSNPISAEFAVGEEVLFSSHTSGGNNVSAVIYATNVSGNNIICSIPTGATQGGIAGTADVQRFVYTLTAPASATDYVVGQRGHFSGHPSGGNNGDFPITGVNINAGNNVAVYNPGGVVDGTAAGNVDTNWWVFTLPTDPSSEFSVGHSFYANGTGYDGVYQVVQVNRAAVDSLVVYDYLAITAAGNVGAHLAHTRVKFVFDSDQSLFYNTDSRIEVVDTFDSSAFSANFPIGENLDIDVVQVNHGGGSNYNVVGEILSVVAFGLGANPLPAMGRIATESKSIFSTKPSMTFTPTNTTGGEGENMGVCLVATNGVYNSYASLTDGDILGFNVDEVPLGPAANIVMQIG